MHIHSSVVVRKIRVPPLYTLRMETSRAFSIVLGNSLKKRQKFLANLVVFRRVEAGRSMMSDDPFEFSRGLN